MATSSGHQPRRQRGAWSHSFENPSTWPTWHDSFHPRGNDVPSIPNREVVVAKDAIRGQLTWIKGPRKVRMFLIRLLLELRMKYLPAKTIHVIFDNYQLNSSDRIETGFPRDLVYVKDFFDFQG